MLLIAAITPCVAHKKWEAAMSFSPKSIESLIDLVEVRISSIEGIDRNDIRAINRLKKCLGELETYAANKPGPMVVPFPEPGPAGSNA